MQRVLRVALVASKICEIDKSGSYYIQNPYGSQPTGQLQATDGSYSVSAWTTTDDTLTVNNEAIYAEHIYGFEKLLADFNLFSERTDEMAYAIATAVDKYVVNNLCEDGTGTYNTPAGGFTTAANVNTIFSNLISKVAGYEQMYKGLFLVVENTDITGIIEAGAGSGWSFSDMVLKNGWIGNHMGVDIYVVRSGTFVTDTLAGEVVSNVGHRVFGVKGVSTVALPGGLETDEKGVTAKTGKEFYACQQFGFKLWTQNAGLIIDITLV